MFKKCLLTLCGLLAAGSASARDIDHLRAEFSVLLNGDPTRGVNTLTIDRNKDRYHVNFSLAHWLLDVEQKASFKWNDCTARPDTFSYKAKYLGKRPEERLVFDSQTNMVLYQGKGGDKLLSTEGGAFDSVSFFFEARCDLMAGKTTLTYPVVRDGEIKQTTFKVVGKEVVKTGIGSFDSLIVERDRGNSKRRTRFWVAPELDYQLVQISHEENRQLAVTVTLDKLSYRLVDKPATLVGHQAKQ
ncbi:DUF3108 domain-containing protein [Oceanisphaera arctica]|uniref:DUF3108 domain-containing protein n=1 Tax=Oceanisphaera arctica TaxID=641510 RepID=A0A2P5TQ64_9GAMM|nr:DUF3108 domain-containing protein [Oceanisphaera arctica]PPL17879.1 hypothetical protein UN63_03230 [Oceanisphaera arctica]GHA23777.1 hypothetical protein GCM10007082_25560 [Oceanisphaera arctica]